jgi:polyhydroxyalkanoate synthesis regulator phasin
MEQVKNILYAGLGLMKKTEDQTKEQFDLLVAKGKRTDEEGKNLINDLFKTLEEGKSKLGENYNEQIVKVEDFINTLKKK